MSQSAQKICTLYGCAKLVTNWRASCCCKTHQYQYAGKRSRGTENQPNQSTEARIAYHRQWAIEKQRRTKNATPDWTNKEKIREIYELAATLSIETGTMHEVDHIIPLTNKLVCGLHVENNLRVVPMEENRAKRNKFTVEEY